MRNVAVYSKQNTNYKHPVLRYNLLGSFELNEVEIFCGLTNTKIPDFNRNTPENKLKVLVKKKGFSCNYRDKSLIFNFSLNAPKNSFSAIGSDFVGEVIDLGTEVTEFEIGDRVIANNAMVKDDPAVAPGIPSNNGSKEYQIFHQANLIKVPPEMPDEVAAAFSIGGQTSYSIVRKFNPSKGANILITAAKSNTSLFVINALQKYEVNIYATTTSNLFVEKLKALGVKEVIVIEKKPNALLENQAIRKIFKETGGFDCVFDPFFDIYLGQAVQLMNSDAKYITCGLYDQYLSLIGDTFPNYSLDCRDIIVTSLLKNLQIIGNCLGTKEDLNNALQDYAAGNLKVIIDSVYTGNQITEFFDRTYNSKDRFGKVVYQYN